MSDVFDPHYKWLGIPPKDQPPDHYRLLGIEKFESDTEVISLATDQRMSFLRTFQTGEYSELSQQLLNEVTAAKLCLLKSDEKARYDATLRTEATAEDGSDSPGIEATTAWSPKELSVAGKPSDVSPLMTDAAEPTEEPDRQKIRKRSVLLIALGLAATVLLLLIATEDREEKQSASLAKSAESVEEPGEGGPEATFGIGEPHNQPEQQGPVEAEEEAKQGADSTDAKEEADRKAKEEQARKAKEEAERKAKEQADRDAKEEAARKAKEEADRKEQRRAMLKQRVEARRKAEESRRKRKEESRKKEEAWRQDHPEEYLERLGLVKKGNSWQLKDATELKEQTDDLSRQRASLKNNLDGAKKNEREMPGRYKKLEQMLKVNLAKLKKTRSENPGERQTLITWVIALENPDFRKDLITDDFPSKEDLPPGRQWYADKGPQTRDRLIEFLKQRGSSFKPAQQQYLQSIQQLEDRKKNLDKGLDALLNAAREVHQFKNNVEGQWAEIQRETENVTNAKGSVPITPIKTTIEKVDERVAAVLKLKEEIENFLNPPNRDQRGPPPGRPGGNRPRQ